MSQPVDYGGIIRRSFDLTVRHKWLWVYGLVIASLGGGGLRGSGGGGSSSGSRGTPEIRENLPRELPHQTMRVLGVATDAATQWLRSVPPGTWILIAAVLLILVIIAVVVSIIARSWATAGLIFGISDASRGMPVSLVSTGPKGLTRTKHIAVYSVISILILAGVILSFLILLGIGAVFMQIIPPLGVIWMIVSGITAAAGIVLAALFTSLISVYAERLIVLHGYAPWPAWIRGLALSRTNFTPTVIMGLVNSAIGCVVGVVASIPLIASIVFAVVAVAVSAKRSGPTGPDSISLIPYLAVFFTGLILLLIVFQGVVNAALTVWRYGVWHQLFRNFVPEEEKPV